MSYLSLEFLLDPSFYYTFGVILLPIALDPSVQSVPAALEYLTHPSLWVAMFCLAAMHVLTFYTPGPPVRKLPLPERMLGRWYLFNAIIIFMLMDGCVGGLKVNPVLSKQYQAMDKRYGFPFGSVEGSAVTVVSLCELLLKGPLCLLLYVLMYRGSRYVDPVAIVVNVLQFYGTVLYLGQELITGMKNLHVDYELRFSFKDLCYFWFAILFANILYLMFPAYLVVRSMRRIVQDVSPDSNYGHLKTH